MTTTQQADIQRQITLLNSLTGAILSIGAGWGTLEHFFRRDLKQYRR